MPLAVADLGGGWGGYIPPTSVKVTILAKISASIWNNSAPFRDASPPHRPKRNESGRKISLNFGEDFFFFFFGDHLILAKKTFEFPISAEKSLSILVLFFFFFFFFWRPILAKKTFEFPISAEKSLSILVKTFFFFFFFFWRPPDFREKNV